MDKEIKEIKETKELIKSIDELEIKVKTDKEEKTEYDYYICVLDFEATCEDKSTWENEIIEFPSVLWGWNFKEKTLTYIGEFRDYCKPVLNPILTPFCTDLTKITQETVDKGYKFTDTFVRHYKWLVDMIGEKNLDSGDKFSFVTCGAWDINQMLPKEVKHWNLFEFPVIYHSWLNVKTVFEKVVGGKAFGMPNMLDKLSLTLDGVHHSGLDDCKNISKIFIKLVAMGYELNKADILSKDYKKYLLSRKKVQELILNWK